MKRCYLSFEMSSEEMLEITPQPANTCDHNHPLHNALDYTYNDLRVAVADAPHAITTIRGLDYDPVMVDELQEAIDTFDGWQDDWRDVYQQHIAAHLSEAEKAQFDEHIEYIDKLLKHDDYQHFDVHGSVRELEECFSDIEKSIEAAFHAHSEHEDEISSLRDQIDETQQELDAEDNEDEIDYLQSAISQYEKALEELENAEPWDDHVDDANRALDKYEEIYSRFGNPMQQHYTQLREAVSNLKTMTKHFIEDLQAKQTIDMLLPYPEDHLSTLIAEHSKKGETIVAATPTIFIKRVRELEASERVLDDDDHELLMEGAIDRYALPAAMKRFKHDYPDYQRLLTFEDTQQAITLGKRCFLPLAEPTPRSPAIDYSEPELAMG